VHVLVGAGAVARAGGSGLDIANLLKPPLARGELQCIGATTLDDHRKYIETDAALERRFQPVLVREPSQAQALDILHGLQVGGWPWSCMPPLPSFICAACFTVMWIRL
jgi:ATP-dependent Clp protease ATP-binding subunit ClpC